MHKHLACHAADEINGYPCPAEPGYALHLQTV